MQRFLIPVLCLFAVVGLVLSFDLATYATDGNSLILGRINQASTTTTLVSGSGPALSLKAKTATAPPLAVSNSVKVTRLNADLLDGLDGPSLRNDTRRATFDSTAPQFAGVYATGLVPAGDYLATFSTSLLPSSATNTGGGTVNAQCQLTVGSKSYGGDEAPYTGAYAVLLSGADVISLSSQSLVEVRCATNTASYTFYQPLVVTLTTTHLVGDGVLDAE